MVFLVLYMFLYCFRNEKFWYPEFCITGFQTILWKQILHKFYKLVFKNIACLFLFSSFCLKISNLQYSEHLYILHLDSPVVDILLIFCHFFHLIYLYFYLYSHLHLHIQHKLLLVTLWKTNIYTSWHLTAKS